MILALAIIGFLLAVAGVYAFATCEEPRLVPAEALTFALLVSGPSMLIFMGSFSSGQWLSTAVLAYLPVAGALVCYGMARGG